MFLAYVRYADGACGILPSCLIKDFEPTHVADYKKGDTKKAFWFRKRDGQMQGYYDAEVKVLAGKTTLNLNVACFRSSM